MLLIELFAFRATVHYVHVVPCRAVQRLTARKMIIAAGRVATLNGAANLSTVRQKDRSGGPVFGLDPLDSAVHMFAWSERCRAMLLMWWGWGGAGPPLRGPRRCVCWVLGFALLDPLLKCVESSPTHIHVGLLCLLRCGVRCLAGCLLRCRAGSCIRRGKRVPLVIV